MRYLKKRKRLGILFIIPSFLGVCIFVLLPYMDILLRSFNVTGGNGNPSFVNYEKVLSNSAFRLAVKNTVYFTCVSIPLLIVLSLLIAYFIASRIKNSKWVQTGVLLPMVIPVSTVVILWNAIFHEYGFLNKILQFPPGGGVDWMNDRYAMGVLVLTFLWRNIGFAIVLWIAGISAIPSAMTEAARIDGANGRQRFLYIVCPNLVYYFLCITMLALVNSFKIYREAYLIAGEYPAESIYMLQHLFNNWFRDLQVANLSAGAVIQLVITVLALFLLLRVCVRKGLEL